MISQKSSELGYIAEITTLALSAGIDDITSFLILSKLQLCLSYT
jgi:hypothetical protein